MKQKVILKNEKKGIKAETTTLKKDKLFKRKIILLSIILFLFIILILDKEFGLFVKIFGDRTIEVKRLW